ncbi:MAG: DUF1932 domain-containing protein [Chloroflexota bacterium]|nr:DUF1932 domain-containing protein [Chloroflexota bacterium]
MTVETVGVMSPGDLGSGVGGVLAHNGLRVITSLQGRSEASSNRAAEQGIVDVGSLDDLVTASDLILSILVPSEALAFAESVGESIVRTGSQVAFADCNAVSPSTGIKIGEIVTDAGGTFIDAGIIGGSPRTGATPRFYASGEYAMILAELDGKGIAVPVMNGPVGHASAIKMFYAALTKGTAALYSATLMSAEKFGLLGELLGELQDTQTETLQAMNSVNSISTKAFRWIGEMHEIAETFASVGLPSEIHTGAAKTFQMIADSSIGHERVDTLDKSRILEDSIAAMLLPPN